VTYRWAFNWPNGNRSIEIAWIYTNEVVVALLCNEISIFEPSIFRFRKKNNTPNQALVALTPSCHPPFASVCIKLEKPSGSKRSTWPPYAANLPSSNGSQATYALMAAGHSFLMMHLWEARTTMVGRAKNIKQESISMVPWDVLVRSTRMGSIVGTRRGIYSFLQSAPVLNRG
jgi:hypothetical protein